MTCIKFDYHIFQNTLLVLIISGYFLREKKTSKPDLCTKAQIRQFSKLNLLPILSDEWIALAAKRFFTFPTFLCTNGVESPKSSVVLLQKRHFQFVLRTFPPNIYYPRGFLTNWIWMSGYRFDLYMEWMRDSFS